MKNTGRKSGCGFFIIIYHSLGYSFKNLLFSFVFIILVSPLFGQLKKEYLNDNRIIIQEGLSQSRILSILEDKRGFMWFGTDDGLNRYDGYTIKVFRNIFNDSISLPNNTINSMVEDAEGNIWLGTKNGIALFDPYSETFNSIVETDSNAIAAGANIITSCIIDENQNIWCGTDGYGIIRINVETFEKKYYFNKQENDDDLRHITKLFIDSKQRVWIGGYIDGNITVYNPGKGNISKYNMTDINGKPEKSKKVESFFEDNQGRIWANVVDYHSTTGSLFYLEKNKSSFDNYAEIMSEEVGNGFLDSFNSIKTITGDNDGNILFCSVLSGVFKFRFGNDPIAYYMDSPVTDSRINYIYLSKNGLLWIGTNGRGIELSAPDDTDFKLISYKNNIDFKIESIRTFAEDSNYYWVGGYYGFARIDKDFSNIKLIHQSSVYSILNSRYNENIIYTGSEGGGLQPFNKGTESYSNLGAFSDNEIIPPSEYIYVIHNLCDSLVLLGTQSGLVGYNPIKNSRFNINFTKFDSIENKNHIPVRSICTDNKGNILIGYVQGGIGKLSDDFKTVELFETIPDLQFFQNYNPVNCIYNDLNNDYWIATSNGLIYYMVSTGDIKLYTEADGLPNSHIYGILPDEDNNLWLSTNNGISCYCRQDNIFRNYDISDGLQNNEFNTGAYYKAVNGDLFFGGIDGFNYFNPREIKRNSTIPTLVLTGVTVSNKALKVSKESFNNNTITIQPEHEIFSVEFAGLSFINSNKNQYKYRIEEVNEEWIELGNQHRITFTNLPPGNYNLEIMASNNHGLWITEPFKCEMVVLPTFFESDFFKWVTAIFIVLILIFSIKLRLSAITRQKNKLQSLVNQQTATLLVTNESLKEEIQKHSKTASELLISNKTKDKFLSIIAHDLLSPLGVVLGFSDLLVDESYNFNEVDRKSFNKTINLTTKRLISLLTNLLQWSKLQSGSLIPNPQELDIAVVMDEVLALLQANILEKEIRIINNVKVPTIVYTDKNMLLIILRNLVSNAIKFTDISGEIMFDSLNIGDIVQIEISDNGVGISDENIKKLFNPEANFTTKGTNEEPGTGIGLGLVKEFIELNGGKLWVKSKVNKGSTFYFTLPKIV
jgi:signal transduction histidine kinase/ligand-binding sensor domain-containing protein